MKKTNWSQFWVAVLTLQAFVLNPLAIRPARADSVSASFHQTCDKVYAAQNDPKATQPGTNLIAECDKAKLGVSAHDAEKVKVIAYGVAMGLDIAGAVMGATPPYTAAAAGKAICKYATLAGSLTGSIEDLTASDAMSQTMNAFQTTAMKTVDTFSSLNAASSAGIGLGSGAGGGLLGIIKDASSLESKGVQLLGGANNGATGTTTNFTIEHSGSLTDGTAKVNVKQTNTSNNNGKNGDCIMAAIMMGFEFGISVYGESIASKAVGSSVDTAKQQIAAAAAGAQSYSLGFNGGNTGFAPSPKADGSSAGPSEVPCGGQSGNSQLSCLGSTFPSAEMSAITSSPGFLNAAQKALGMPLADFASKYNGNTPQDAANYIAGGLGLSGDAAAQLANSLAMGQQVAKDSGLLDKYTPSSYIASNHSTGSSAPASDFGGLMSSMLKQLNPDAAADKQKDPAELVFRQLDLLPAEKVIDNKNISLFARIGYRYRKVSGEVQQLNWASEQNQQSAGRTPASVPVTQPGSTTTK